MVQINSKVWGRRNPALNQVVLAKNFWNFSRAFRFCSISMLILGQETICLKSSKIHVWSKCSEMRAWRLNSPSIWKVLKIRVSENAYFHFSCYMPSWKYTCDRIANVGYMKAQGKWACSLFGDVHLDSSGDQNGCSPHHGKSNFRVWKLENSAHVGWGMKLNLRLWWEFRNISEPRATS